jgi:serine protease Do
MSSVLTEWAVARRALARKAALSVVGIDRGQGVRLSGIVWDSETLVTAAEILHGADTVTVQTDNEAVPAEILACDLSVDVAVLRARTGASGVSTTNSTGLAAGDDVLVAGRSHTGSALLWTHVEQVGPAWRSRSGGALNRLIRLSPGLHPTLEGGGTFDLEGRLCAMAVRGPRHQTIGIPSETIGRIVSTVREHGRLPQPYLGIRLQPVGLDESLRQQLSRDSSNGAIVVGVEPESPAAAAGLLFGDLIVSVAGQPIHNAIDLKIALSEMALGSPVEVQVYRAGASLELTVSVRERARY